MFDRTLDLIIIAFLVLFIVMFAIGKGDVLLSLFSSAQAKEMNEIYDRKQMDRASLLLCIVLLISELMLVFLGRTFSFVPILALVISIAAFAIYIAYMQKIRKK